MASSRRRSRRQQGLDVDGVKHEDVDVGTRSSSTSKPSYWRAPKSSMPSSTKSSYWKDLERARIPIQLFDAKNFNPFNWWETESDSVDRWLRAVDGTLVKVIETHHKGFNRSTASFSSILQTFTESQVHCIRVNEATAEARRLLSSTSQHSNRVRSLASDASKMRLALGILERISAVASIPARLQRYIQEKKFCHAVVVLTNALSTLFDDDLKDMNALNDIHSELLSTRNTLQQAIIDELHSQIYVKHPHTRDSIRRFGAYPETTPNMSTPNSALVSAFSSISIETQVESNSSSILLTSSEDNHVNNGIDLESEQVFGDEQIALHEDERISSEMRALLRVEVEHNYSVGPHVDSYEYMSSLLHALAYLHRLPSARAALLKCLRAELRSAIDVETKIMKEELLETQSQDSDSPSPSVSVVISSPSSRMNSNTSEKSSKRFMEMRSTLLELLERVFRVLTRIIANHVHVSTKLLKLEASANINEIIDANAYTIDRVWIDMQNEVWTMLQAYIQTRTPSITSFPSVTQCGTSSVSPSTNQLRIQFSFANSNAASITHLSREGVHTDESNKESNGVDEINGLRTMGASTWIVAAVEHITVVYRPLVQFTDQATSLISGHTSRKITSSKTMSSDHILRRFVSAFVENTFVPRVRAEVNFQLKEAFLSNHAFTIRDMKVSSASASSSESSSSSLLHCAQAVFDVLQRVFADYFVLPYDRTNFISIVDNILTRFLEKCQKKFDAICSEIYSRALINEPNVIDIMKKNPLLQRLQCVYGDNVNDDSAPLSTSQSDEIDASALHAVHADEIQIYYRLFNRLDKLHKSQLLWSPDQWLLIASISESLRWLSNRIRELCRPLKSEADISSPSSSSRHSSASSIPIAPQVTLSAAIAASFIALANKCMFTLRIEFHCHAFYIIAGGIESCASYVLQNECIEPQPFVIDFHQDMLRAHDTLRTACSSSQVHCDYVFGCQSYLLGTIIMKSITRLPNNRVNRYGVDTMIRNILALQKNITSIVSMAAGGADELERARQYWELLNTSNLAQALEREDMTNLFSEDERRCLLNIKQERTRVRTTPINTQSQ